MEQFINKYSSLIIDYLYTKGIRIFDYAKFAEGLRDSIRKQTDSVE
jgi:hypothetical protein